MAENKYDHSKYGNEAKPNGVLFVKGEILKVNDVVWFEATENFKHFVKGNKYRVHRWLFEGIKGNADSEKKSLKGRGIKAKIVEAPKPLTVEQISLSDIPKNKK